MGWFLAQSWLFLLAAFALGVLVGWLWWARRPRAAGEPSGTTATPAAAVPADVKAVADETDTALAERDAARAERDEAVAARQDALAAVGEAVAERDAARAERDEAAAARDAAVAERERAAEEHRLEIAGKNAALAGRDTEVQRLRALTAAGDGEIQRLRALTAVTPQPFAAVGSPEPARDATAHPSTGTPGHTAAPAGTDDAPHGDGDGDGDGGGTDDLQRIEGIGPKIASVLAADGVRSYRRLAALDEDDLRRILTGAGVTFAPSVATWPQQARLLADGDLDGHAALAATLTAGRPTSGPVPVIPVEAEPEPKQEDEDTGEDDLERIEGVGPRIAAALRAARIRTFRRLSEADVVELQAALEASGLRFAPSLPTWSRQAAFLADGDEAGFEALTDSLVAGRERGGRN